jgi:hypothetical protein
MSKLGNFVLECQTIAQDYYNEPKEVVAAEVKKTFPASDFDYALETVEMYIKEIYDDMEGFGSNSGYIS